MEAIIFIFLFIALIYVILNALLVAFIIKDKKTTRRQKIFGVILICIFHLSGFVIYYLFLYLKNKLSDMSFRKYSQRGKASNGKL